MKQTMLALCQAECPIGHFVIQQTEQWKLLYLAELIILETAFK